MARDLKFGFKKKRDCTIRVVKIKTLISFAVSYREADLRLCFCIRKNSVFLTSWLILYTPVFLNDFLAGTTTTGVLP